MSVACVLCSVYADGQQIYSLPAYTPADATDYMRRMN